MLGFQGQIFVSNVYDFLCISVVHFGSYSNVFSVLIFSSLWLLRLRNDWTVNQVGILDYFWHGIKARYLWRENQCFGTGVFLANWRKLADNFFVCRRCFHIFYSVNQYITAVGNVALAWCRKRASGLPQLDTGGEESSHDGKKKLWLQGLQYGSRANCYFALCISLGGWVVWGVSGWSCAGTVWELESMMQRWCLASRGARWTGCWDTLWTASEGAEYLKESGSGNQWLVRWSLTVWGSNGSASHGYVFFSEFRVGSRDASGGAATAVENLMVEQSARPLSWRGSVVFRIRSKAGWKGSFYRWSWWWCCSTFCWWYSSIRRYSIVIILHKP